MGNLIDILMHTILYNFFCESLLESNVCTKFNPYLNRIHCLSTLFLSLVHIIELVEIVEKE
jgi:hypothetical protein